MFRGISSFDTAIRLAVSAQVLIAQGLFRTPRWHLRWASFGGFSKTYGRMGAVCF